MIILLSNRWSNIQTVLKKCSTIQPISKILKIKQNFMKWKAVPLRCFKQKRPVATRVVFVPSSSIVLYSKSHLTLFVNTVQPWLTNIKVGYLWRGRGREKWAASRSGRVPYRKNTSAMRNTLIPLHSDVWVAQWLAVLNILLYYLHDTIFCLFRLTQDRLTVALQYYKIIVFDAMHVNVTVFNIT